MTFLTCLLCGLAPALRLARTEPAEVIKTGGRGLTTRPEGSAFQRLLVVTQIAVSLVLVVGALLFARSFQGLLSVDAGFRQDGILYAFCDLSPRNLQPAAFAPAKAAILDRIRALPQVEGAGSSTKIPLTGGSWTLGISVEGRTVKDDWSRVTWVSPGFFQALDVPVLAGRNFTRADTVTSPRVMLVNETFVKRYLKDRPAVGIRVRTAKEPGYPETDYQIVGVVRDVKYSDLREDIPPTSFVPDEQAPEPRPWMAIVVRASGDAGAVSAAIRRTLTAEGVRNSPVTVLRQQVREGLSRERLMSWLSGAFGVIAGLLAAIGLYGVMSYGVARRANEIAIRMALGAAARDVLMLMLAAGRPHAHRRSWHRNRGSAGRRTSGTHAAVRTRTERPSHARRRKRPARGRRPRGRLSAGRQGVTALAARGASQRIDAIASGASGASVRQAAMGAGCTRRASQGGTGRTSALDAPDAPDAPVCEVPRSRVAKYARSPPAAADKTAVVQTLRSLLIESSNAVSPAHSPTPKPDPAPMAIHRGA